MQILTAHFKDELHDTFIEIVNTEKDAQDDPLSFTLDSITFRGSSLGNFQLSDETQYDEAKEKFHILKAGPYNVGDNTAGYLYTLQRYALDVEIPVKVLRKRDGCELPAVIHLSFEYKEHDMEKRQSIRYCDDVRVYQDDVKVSDFSLLADGAKYSSTRKIPAFDLALPDICRQMSKEYYLKSCFTCQYSEYSPYGGDDYGSMLCYRNNKEECLKVHNKDDYFEYLEDKDFEMRQETFLCEEYEPRNKCSGYRGFVDGVDHL